MVLFLAMVLGLVLKKSFENCVYMHVYVDAFDIHNT